VLRHEIILHSVTITLERKYTLHTWSLIVSIEVHRSTASLINKKHVLFDVTSEFKPSPFRFSFILGRAVHV
jgi:hypothetical protein